MKKFTFAPIAIFTLTMILAGCSTQAPQKQDIVPVTPEAESQPLNQEPKKPFEVKYGDLVIGQQCLDECQKKTLEVIEFGNFALWDIPACQMGCQTLENQKQQK